MKYKAKPVIVDAFSITRIEEAESDTVLGQMFNLTLDNGAIVVADWAMTARYAPVLGDYLVIQEDGYIYINPKTVFERKYEPIEAVIAEGSV